MTAVSCESRYPHMNFETEAAYKTSKNNTNT